jgi:3-dehydroquinate dehydratase
MFAGPIIELHISNIHRARCDLSPLPRLHRRDGGDRDGFGAPGYYGVAVRALREMLRRQLDRDAVDLRRRAA